MNRLQQCLLSRSQEVDKLNMGICSIAEHCQLPHDQLQWIMGEGWKQQQQLVLQQSDQLHAELHEKDILISSLQHQINELQNKKVEAETYRRIKGKNMTTERIEGMAAKLDSAQMVCIKILGYKCIPVKT